MKQPRSWKFKLPASINLFSIRGKLWQKLKFTQKALVRLVTWLKKIFNEKGATFKEFLMDDKPEELNQLKAQTGLQTVPQIFINGEMIGGCSDLMKLDEDKKLDPMLAVQSE